MFTLSLCCEINMWFLLNSITTITHMIKTKCSLSLFLKHVEFVMQCYEQTRYSYIKHVNVIQQSRIGFKDAIMLFWYQRSILCNINYGGFVVLVHGLIQCQLSACSNKRLYKTMRKSYVCQIR